MLHVSLIARGPHSNWSLLIAEMKSTSSLVSESSAAQVISWPVRTSACFCTDITKAVTLSFLFSVDVHAAVSRILMMRDPITLSRSPAKHQREIRARRRLSFSLWTLVSSGLTKIRKFAFSWFERSLAAVRMRSRSSFEQKRAIVIGDLPVDFGAI